MDIIFIDPGYGKGFSVSSGGSLTSVESEEYNPVNGVAFTANGNFLFPVPSSLKVAPSNYCLKKTSFRFSVYLDPTFSGTLSAGNMDYNPNTRSFTGSAAAISISQNSCSARGASASSEKIDIATPITGFHNVAISTYISGKSGSGSACYNMTKVDIDGNCNIQRKSWTTGLNATAGIDNYFAFCFPTQTGCYISNVIIATLFEYIDNPSTYLEDFQPLLTSEHLLVKLPLKNTSTDFSSVGGGEYVGNASGQKLLQTIDTSDAVAKFGDTSKVSHLVVYGNPGYRVGSNITEAYGISESDSSIAAHGSCSLSTDTDASAAVAWAVDNTRLSDVDGMKIGWQV